MVVLLDMIVLSPHDWGAGKVVPSAVEKIPGILVFPVLVRSHRLHYRVGDDCGARYRPFLSGFCAPRYGYYLSDVRLLGLGRRFYLL